MKEEKNWDYQEIISIEEYLNRRQKIKESEKLKRIKNKKSSVFVKTELYAYEN